MASLQIFHIIWSTTLEVMLLPHPQNILFEVLAVSACCLLPRSPLGCLNIHKIISLLKCQLLSPQKLHSCHLLLYNKYPIVSHLANYVATAVSIATPYSALAVIYMYCCIQWQNLKYVPNIVIFTDAIIGQTSHMPLQIYIYIIEVFSILLTQLTIRVEHNQFSFEVMELKAHILFSTSKVDDTVCFNYFFLFVVSCHNIFVVIYDITIYFLQCSGDEIKHLLKGHNMCCYCPCNIGKILLNVLKIPS